MHPSSQRIAGWIFLSLGLLLALISIGSSAWSKTSCPSFKKSTGPWRECTKAFGRTQCGATKVPDESASLMQTTRAFSVLFIIFTVFALVLCIGSHGAKLSPNESSALHLTALVFGWLSFLSAIITVSSFASFKHKYMHQSSFGYAYGLFATNIFLSLVGAILLTVK